MRVNPPPADINERVLIFAPIGRDAALTCDLLAGAGIGAEICGSPAQLCAEIAQGAAAVVLTQEIFEFGGLDEIAARLRAQPPWSDIPVLLFTGSEGRALASPSLAALEHLTNVTLLDRPVRVSVALSIIRAALRARTRQLEVRDLLLAVEASRHEAETASRLKDEFLATLSHELRTPLNAILGWTAMLRNGAFDGARTEKGLEIIDRNARAQAQLVDDVLDMARIITGKLRVNFKMEPLVAVLDAAIDSLRPAALAKRIALDLSGVTDAVSIRGDADRLQQVFWNLLSNAVKFTPEDGRIVMRLERSASHVAVSVTDSGAGLDPAFMPLAFDRFRQADQTVTRGHGGLGLGLAIVKHLVELHGGSVSAQSPGLGCGSTFTVTLPIPTVRVGDDSVASTRAPVPGLRPGCAVLVVDEDESTRELLSELFGAASASVRTASSASSALEAVRDEPPHVIIAGIGRSDENALSFIRRIRALPPPASAVPAIALSAYTRAEDRAAALSSGFSAYVTKPASPHQLLVLVGKLLAAGDVSHPI